MARKLFCEINPLTYKISMLKGIIIRRIKWQINKKKYANMIDDEKLPIVVYKHKSLIRRKLGNVDMQIQENKAINLSLAAPRVNGIIINPNEIFSFWKLVGKCTKRKGYKEGLVIKSGEVNKDIGGGMCQFTNLIHWMILHSPLTIIEHHHHNGFDMFPDYGRQVPFGVGTSIMYNYLDYQFINKTNQTFQLLVYTTDKYLCGELRSNKEIECSYHILEEENYFTLENNAYYRNNIVHRKVVDKETGNIVNKQEIIKNHSKVLYDKKYISVDMIKDN